MRRRLMGCLLALGTVMICFVLVEVGLRLVFAFEVGQSVLLHGTRYGDGVERLHRRLEPAPQVNRDALLRNRRFRRQAGERVAWRADREISGDGAGSSGYRKYAPHQIRIDRDQITGEQFDVRINRHGFRGADFAIAKEPGVIRVVTLGASSTFGYYSRDTTTYPLLLGEMLSSQCARPARYEVINLGIPHLLLGEIRALFHAEVPPLAPDVVTLYAGRNDSLRAVGLKREKGPFDGVVDALGASFISIAFLDSMIDLRGLRSSPAEIDAKGEQTSADFLATLAALQREIREIGGLFFVVSQQAASMTIPREQLRGLSYRAEATEVRARLEGAQERLRVQALSYLVHEIMMRDLRAWAAGADVAFVDGIAALDADRHELLSWVHLSPRGNLILATAIANAILDHTCEVRHDAPPSAAVHPSAALRAASASADPPRP